MRYSRQREAIFELVQHSKKHPTADEIYAIIKKTYPTISLATIYRNLNHLTDQGKLLRLPVADGPVRFDGRLDGHSHMICDQCSKVLDYNVDILENMRETIEEQTGFSPAKTSYVIHGICKECREQ